MIELVDVRLDHPKGGGAIVTGANLRVPRGEVVMIVGAAGVGTSRLVAASLGEVQPSAGRIEVMGHDLKKLRRASLRLLRRRVGIVPQDLCLLEDRSAQLNVVLPLEIDGIPRSMSLVRAGEVMEQLCIEDEATLPVGCLSAAERQRVAVARALVRRPELVVADHPTTAQDADGTELVCAALMGAAAGGAAVIICGRDPALLAIAQRCGWRQLGLVGGQLRPLVDLAPSAIDELLDDAFSAPTPLHPHGLPAEPSTATDEEIPNVVPFPLSARTAGVA
jgi:cell division transport system ATP-binding protein